MKKTFVRIITLILAIILILTMFSGVGAMIARAEDDTTAYEPILTADTSVNKTITRGKVTTELRITFYLSAPSLSKGEYSAEDLSMPADSSFSWGKNTRLVVSDAAGEGHLKCVLHHVTYNGGASQILRLTILSLDMDFAIPLSNKFFRDAAEDDEAPIPDIVVQSVKLTDASGQTLDKVTKDTAPFTVEITFYDMGLKDESRSELDNSGIHAFATSATGFKTLSGTGGTVETLNPSGGYPRFRATFKNIKSDGTSSSFGFRIQYDLTNYEKSVKGEAIAVLFQVVTEEEEGEIAPLKPNVIVQSYTYGGETIVAGEQFDLDIEFINTSKTLGVENVVMTIEPGNGFVIAASSNTMFVPALAPGETKPYSVALRAAASGNAPVAGTAGTQTDYSVQVKFEYQYLSKKEYLTGNTSIKIAIPVVQLDRFAVDEITDYSQYLTAGEEGYISVPITNKGKSPTYNISAEVRSSGGAEFLAPAVHYSGNLEASKSGTVDLSIIIYTPGEFVGEVVVTYEDENMSQKHIAVPFSIMVAEPYVPEPEQPDLPAEPESVPINPLQMLFCGLGALMVAVPIALYLIKRVKARGNEDIDESF